MVAILLKKCLTSFRNKHNQAIEANHLRSVNTVDKLLNSMKWKIEQMTARIFQKLVGELIPPQIMMINREDHQPFNLSKKTQT